MRTLLSGGVVVTCDEAHSVFDRGDVVIDDARIAYVGPAYDGPYDVRLPVTDRLVMPGMVNAHTHSAMTIMRSLADDVDLMVFLEDRVWPREILLTPDEIYAGTVLADIEMMKAGITSYVDMYFHEEALAQAALDTGVRAMIAPAILDAPAWEPVLGKIENQVDRVLTFRDRWDGRDGRIHCWLGPHAPYTVPFEMLLEIGRAAKEHDVPISIHLVETAGEREQFNAQGRGGTIAALAEGGFFDARVLAAHSIWVEEGDLEIYAGHGAGVCHCPQSNAKLGAGIAPVAAMLAHQVHVGLGTDGACTNNNLDLWEEMRMAPLLAKVSALDPKPVKAEEALWMATRLGGLAAFRPDLGVLREGATADVITVKVDDSRWVPIFSPSTYISHIVYSAGSDQVDSVWVNGKQTVKGGEVLTVDEEAARRTAQQVAMGVSRRAGRS